jgi:hypothetical protein
VERFNLKKINEVDGKKECRFQVSNGFAALYLDAEIETNTLGNNQRISEYQPPHGISSQRASGASYS